MVMGWGCAHPLLVQKFFLPFDPRTSEDKDRRCGWEVTLRRSRRLLLPICSTSSITAKYYWVARALRARVWHKCVDKRCEARDLRIINMDNVVRDKDPSLLLSFGNPISGEGVAEAQSVPFHSRFTRLFHLKI
jgi:hypothetical protein